MMKDQYHSAAPQSDALRGSNADAAANCGLGPSVTDECCLHDQNGYCILTKSMRCALGAEKWHVEPSFNRRTLKTVYVVKRGYEFLRMDGKFTTIRRFRTEAGAQRACNKANAGGEK